MTLNLNKEKKDNSPLINDRIRFPQMQVITERGENVGVVARAQALRLAQEAGLDLVILSEQGKDGYPVAKIMDFGKSLYEKKKKSADAKKHQKVIQVKEVKFSPKIGEHDYQTKVRQMVDFLNEGKRVKVTLFFKGRENAMKEERGNEIFDKINSSFEQHDLLKNLVQEQDSKMGSMWSRIYYLKSAK